MSHVLEFQDLGRMPYREALSLQDELREARIRGEIADRVLFVRHPPVFTTGRRDCSGDFLSTQKEIAADGIEVVGTGRGGRVTYHGPGQLVVYFICELSGFGMGIREFVSAIEGACIRLLEHYGVAGARDPGHPGIWVGKDKIVAIGMHVAHGVTQHGLALNVGGDLSPYRHIIACGIRDRGVTSMALQGAGDARMDDIASRVQGILGDLFQRKAVLIRGCVPKAMPT